VLADGALAERLATAGRRLAEERYDWKVVAARVVADLVSLTTPTQAGEIRRAADGSDLGERAVRAGQRP
jgi:hypothetical protein